MSENLLGNDVAALYEYVFRKSKYSKQLMRQFFKAGTVSTHGGAINTTYGALVYDQVNREANVHAFIKKVPWEKSGFRVTTSNPTTKGYGGADPGSVGTVVDYTPSELKSIPGFIHSPFDMTLAAGFRAGVDDGLDLWDWLVAINRDGHAQLLNEELLTSAQVEANVGGAVTDPKNETAGGARGKGLESLDRLISADAEEDDLGGSGSGWYDVYEGDVDRDTATTYDSVICRPDASQTTFGTNLPFQLAGVDFLLDTTANNGADPSSQMFVTQRTSKRLLYDELGAQGRFDLTEVKAKLDLNGLSLTSTQEGRDINFAVRAYQGVPIVCDRWVPSNGTTARTATAADGGTGHGHWYLLDQRHIHLKVGIPTIMASTDNPVVRGQFDTRALYLTAEQLYATRFNVHGKLRSIS